MPFAIVEGDIAQMRTDAVVNAANEQLMAGGGVCGALFAGAGFQKMQRACDAIGHCPTGQAVVTPGFDLPARHVIHAVGPVWHGGGAGEEALLRATYRSALARALEVGAQSVAFPLISAGIYGYPRDAARAVAVSEIRSFLDEHDEVAVFLVLYSRASFAQSLARYREVARYVDEIGQRAAALEPDAGATHSALLLSEEATCGEGASEEAIFLAAEAAPAPAAGAEAAAPPAPAARRSVAEGQARPATQQAPRQAPARRNAVPERRSPAPAQDLTWRLAHLDASFSSTVLALIDERGLTDVEVYKRANLSRQVFSKLRKDDDYRPTKQTAVALAIALELDRAQTDSLLRRAGYALGRTSKFDVIVEYFIEEGIYDVFELNEMLFAFDQPLLGSM